MSFHTGRLRDEIDVCVRVGLPALALEDPAWLTAAGGVAGARYRLEKLAVGVLRILFHHLGAIEALLVAQLDAAQVQHAVLHGREHALAAVRRLALVQRRDDAQREVQAGAGIADLRAGHQRRSVVETRRRCRSAGALRDVLVHLAVLVGAGPEALDRGHDHARIERLDVLPGKAHAIERARGEVLDQHIAVLDQRFEHGLALRVLGVDRDRALVVVEHREIQAVDAGNVAQLPARDVTFAGTFHLDDVGAEPRQQLRAGRSRLHVSEIQNLDAV